MLILKFTVDFGKPLNHTRLKRGPLRGYSRQMPYGLCQFTSRALRLFQGIIVVASIVLLGP